MTEPAVPPEHGAYPAQGGRGSVVEGDLGVDWTRVAVWQTEEEGGVVTGTSVFCPCQPSTSPSPSGHMLRKSFFSDLPKIPPRCLPRLASTGTIQGLHPLCFVSLSSQAAADSDFIALRVLPLLFQMRTIAASRLTTHGPRVGLPGTSCLSPKMRSLYYSHNHTSHFSNFCAPYA